MHITLHRNARTTPAVRQEIQNSDQSAKELAARYGVTLATIYKWRKRNDVHDRSHARHTLLSSLSQTEEVLVKSLRQDLDLSLDDIVEVMKRCVNASLSRSSIYRCLKRHNVASKPKSPRPPHGVFDVTSTPGFIHLDVKYLTKLDGKRSYVYVAIDHATRFVYTEILYDLKPKTAAHFLTRFMAEFVCPVHIILTDNGMEWTDRCAGKVKPKATGKHAVDRVCRAHGIEHRLTKPRKPQTNGMVERFNRRINEAIESKKKTTNNSGKNTFLSHQERNDFIERVVYNYNRTRLKCLDYKAPLQALYNHTEDNTKAGIFKPLKQ